MHLGTNEGQSCIVLHSTQTWDFIRSESGSESSSELKVTEVFRHNAKV